jgi:hypothetical protein
LEIIASKCGRLLKVDTLVSEVPQKDFQRGRLPYYVVPHGFKEEAAESPAKAATIDGVRQVTQDLGKIGEEKRTELGDNDEKEMAESLEESDDEDQEQAAAAHCFCSRLSIRVTGGIFYPMRNDNRWIEIVAVYGASLLILLNDDHFLITILFD